MLPNTAQWRHNEEIDGILEGVQKYELNWEMGIIDASEAALSCTPFAIEGYSHEQHKLR